MTIPTLIQKNFEKRTVTQLKAFQSILSQAIRSAEEEYGSMDGWGITGYDEESAIIIANNLKKGLKLSLDCGVEDTEGQCAPNVTYKLLNGGNNVNIAVDKRLYKVKLSNGMSVYISGRLDGDMLAVFYIDTNGESGPNVWGKDIFQFYYMINGMYAGGHPLKATPTTATSCHKEGTGFGCAYQVMHNQNMNYLNSP